MFFQRNSDNGVLGNLLKRFGMIFQLIYEYDFGLDIIYSDIEFNDNLPKLYDKLFFWSEIIK